MLLNYNPTALNNSHEFVFLVRVHFFICIIKSIIWNPFFFNFILIPALFLFVCFFLWDPDSSYLQTAISMRFDFNYMERKENREINFNIFFALLLPYNSIFLWLALFFTAASESEHSIARRGFLFLLFSLNYYMYLPPLD